MFYGLAGFYIVEDDRGAPDLPAGDFDVPLVIQDRAFNADGSLRYTENIDQGFMGDTIVVNGSVSPRFAVKRALYRLRFLNASNARAYELAALERRSAGPDRRRRRPARGAGVTHLDPAGAGRADRRRGRLPAPAGPARRSSSSTGSGPAPPPPCMRFDVTGARADSGRVPATLRPREEIPAPVATRRWDLMFSTTGAPRWEMSGLGFDDGPDRRPRAARHHRALAVRQQLAPAAPDAHPRRALPRARPLGGQRCTPATARGRTRSWWPSARRSSCSRGSRRTPGRYVFHCHNLEHQERAMMLQLEVV